MPPSSGKGSILQSTAFLLGAALGPPVGLRLVEAEDFQSLVVGVQDEVYIQNRGQNLPL